MDASTYGRMVERGGSATGGAVQSTGFTLISDGTPETRFAPPAVGLVSRLDTSVTVAAGAESGSWLAALINQALQTGQIRLVRPDDDGAAGVPAKV